jgi:multicomponent Na+:H+ antiporter subunit B
LKILSLFAGVLVGAALIYGTLDMPKWGDPHSPASTHVSPYYLQHSIEHTATPNVVTSVLADYRGYDTLGETTVVFTAGMACLLLLKKGRKRQGK